MLSLAHGSSVASAIAGVFAKFPNKIARIMGKFEHIDSCLCS